MNMSPKLTQQLLRKLDDQWNNPKTILKRLSTEIEQSIDRKIEINEMSTSTDTFDSIHTDDTWKIISEANKEPLP